jgi:serine/threonine protein kinase
MPATSSSPAECRMQNAKSSADAGSAIPNSALRIPHSRANGQRGKVSNLIGELGPESSLDAERILSEHPSLRRSKSAVLDLAYEEYCRRVDAGEEVDVHGFVRRFPGYQTSLLRQIEAHEWLAGCPELLGAPIVWPTQGEEFLGFRLREELGRGAFSRVFLAEELALGQRAVVVKVSRLSGMEPRALGRLRHPHIVPVHSVQFDARSGLSAICMPFYGRATLYDLLDHAFRQGTAPPHGCVVHEAIRRASAVEDPADDAPPKAARDWWATSYVNAVVRLGVQLSEALEFAHRGGIFHCDIKPSNVLLCRSGVRLIDFNLALGEGAVSGRGGTLPYMAPEQLRPLAGNNMAGNATGNTTDKAPTNNDPASRIDARTDLFSLGVLLYELLSGQLPWGPLPTHLPAQRVAQELLDRHERGPKPLRRLAPGLNSPLARVFESCLAFRPEHRLATAAEFGLALRREMGWLPRGIRFSQQHRRAMLASALSTLLLGGTGAALALAREPATDRLRRYAKQALRDQDCPRVIEYCELLLASERDDRQAHFWKARAHMLSEQYDRALAELKLLSQTLPQSPYVALCAGFCLAATAKGPDDFAQASEFLRTVEEHFSHDPAFCNNLGYCLVELGEPQRAIPWLEASLTRAPSAVAHHNLALAHFKMAGLARDPSVTDNEFSRAKAEMRNALQSAPSVVRYQIDGLAIDATALRHEANPSKRNAELETLATLYKKLAECGASQHDLTRAWGPARKYAPLPAVTFPPHPPQVPSPPRVLDPLLLVDVLSLDLSP